MGIDSSIYQAFTPQAKSFEDYNNERMVAQQNRLALALQKQKNDEYTRSIDDANKLRGIVGTFTDDRAGNQQKLLQAGRLKEAEDYGKETLAVKKADLENQKAQIEQHLQRFAVAGQIMAGVKDQATWDQARAQTARAFGPEAAAQMPAIYDPQAVEQKRLQAMPVQQQLQAEHQKIADKLAADKFAYDQKNDKANRDVTMRGQNMTAETARKDREQRGTLAEAPTYDTERGVVVDRRKGTASQVLDANGQPLGGKEKPLTEFQGKSAAFADRALLADQALSRLEYSPAAINSKQAVGRTPLIGGALEAATNAMLPAQTQQAEQAQRDFVNAVLRQESGAAIGASEFDNARRQYFPQPGDSPDVIAQKAANRQTAITGLQRNAGATYKAPTSASSVKNNPPAKNSKGWALHVDANGNRAYVSPDGKQFEEVR